MYPYIRVFIILKLQTTITSTTCISRFGERQLTPEQSTELGQEKGQPRPGLAVPSRSPACFTEGMESRSPDRSFHYRFCSTFKFFLNCSPVLVCFPILDWVLLVHLGLFLCGSMCLVTTNYQGAKHRSEMQLLPQWRICPSAAPLLHPGRPAGSAVQEQAGSPSLGLSVFCFWKRLLPLSVLLPSTVQSSLSSALSIVHAQNLPLARVENVSRVCHPEVTLSQPLCLRTEGKGFGWPGQQAVPSC